MLIRPLFCLCVFLSVPATVWPDSEDVIGAQDPWPSDTPWPEAPGAVMPDPETLESLRKGGIAAWTREDGDATAALAQALFKVGSKALWRIIGDCEANLRFVRGLQACEVLEEAPGSALTRQRLKPHALLPSLEYEFETVREPHQWIRIRLVEGELERLTGSWRFDPLPGGEGLLVTHEVLVEPSLPVPRWLARRRVRKDVESLLACLRWEAEAWPAPRQRERDRARCPG